MMIHLKTAMVTDSSRTMGAVIAKRLAQKVFAGVDNFARGAAEADSLAAHIKVAGCNALSIQANVRDPETIARMWDAENSVSGRWP